MFDSIHRQNGAVALTQEQITQYFDKGYLVLPPLFSAEEMRAIDEAFQRLLKVASTLKETQMVGGAKFVVEEKTVNRVVWCGALESELLQLSADARLLTVVGQLLESETMEQLICQAHFKLPGDGVHFRWHQDSENRRFGTPEWEDLNGKGSFVQTVMAVDPATLENAPLMVAEASHLLGHLGLDKTRDTEKRVDSSKMIPLLMSPGDVLLMHPFLVHGSRPNRSKVSRRVFINGYSYPGANRRTYPGEGAGRLLSAKSAAK